MGWVLPYFDHVHHQIGNLIVERECDIAQIQCHGMATHFIAEHPGGDLQIIVGTYDLGLTGAPNGWRLSSMRFNFKYVSGNADLAAEAHRRAADSSKERTNC